MFCTHYIFSHKKITVKGPTLGIYRVSAYNYINQSSYLKIIHIIYIYIYKYVNCYITYYNINIDGYIIHIRFLASSPAVTIKEWSGFSPSLHEVTWPKVELQLRWVPDSWAVGSITAPDRWAPTSYKWGEITPISRVKSPQLPVRSRPLKKGLVRNSIYNGRLGAHVEGVFKHYICVDQQKYIHLGSVPDRTGYLWRF